MRPWKRLSIEDLITHPVHIVRERVRTHTGKELEYVYRPGPVEAVFVLPVTPQGTGLFIRQYRHPTGRFLVEVPAGKVDPGETPEAAARREVLEEVGAAVDTLTPLPPFHPQPSFTAVVFRPFVAFGARQVQPPTLEDGELIETLELPLVEAYQRLEAGEIEDAATALTLFYAERHLRAQGLLG
ncbi:NUDIX hydrolase [Marinithermus hydrothermalis]|uniref:NUDIX hydrolase n=1 Tax=Marinithermus hydrothermalis (strain DSM 14884 / JCM 11576 / T1) TaxID=869210 RepID=F2NMK4_MARHT|nr:NUDIX hydrolase [Marinithermus hydrothermalis]AEB12174.1 NUDIX hydrolase [Marinithermus hydrothermalis DSM 14884]